jgi:hypothetical protein
MSAYLGTVPIDGMSIEQQKACEAATRLAGPSDERHDAILRAIFAALPGPPPWGGGAVNGAIRTALADAGIDVPWL